MTEKVVLFAQATPLATRIKDLIPDHYDCSIVNSLDHLERQLEGAALIIIVLPQLHRTEGGVLRQLSLMEPRVPRVLITDRDPESLRTLTDLVVDRVLFGGEADHLLAKVVDSLLGEERLSSLIRRLIQARNLPPVFRRALVLLLSETIPEYGDAAPTVRSITQLAHRVGCSPDYLAKTASNHGIRLRELVDLVLTTRVLQLWWHSGSSLEQIAWRMGFEHASSVSELVLRVTGRRPSGLRQRNLQELVDRLDQEFLSRLLS